MVKCPHANSIEKYGQVMAGLKMSRTQKQQKCHVSSMLVEEK